MYKYKKLKKKKKKKKEIKIYSAGLFWSKALRFGSKIKNQ